MDGEQRVVKNIQAVSCNYIKIKRHREHRATFESIGLPASAVAAPWRARHHQ